MTADRRYALTIGLCPAQLAGVVGDELQTTTHPTGDGQVVVQLDVEGFELVSHEEARWEFVTSDEEPYPSITVEIVPTPAEPQIEPRAIRVGFTVDGQALGFAVKPIAVVKDDALAAHDAEKDDGDDGNQGSPP